jgi:hypothetical protein
MTALQILEIWLGRNANFFHFGGTIEKAVKI